MSFVPTFANTVVTSTAQVSVANPNRDGTGVMVTVLSAGAASASGTGGTRIDTITIKATGTTTAGMIRLYIATSDDVTQRLIYEYPVQAVTPSGTVPTWGRSERFCGGLLIPAGYKLRASTQNSETFNIVVTFGGDF